MNGCEIPNDMQKTEANNYNIDNKYFGNFLINTQNMPYLLFPFVLRTPIRMPKPKDYLLLNLEDNIIYIQRMILL